MVIPFVDLLGVSQTRIYETLKKGFVQNAMKKVDTMEIREAVQVKDPIICETLNNDFVQNATEKLDTMEKLFLCIYLLH